MMRRLNRRSMLRDQRGVTAIEFAMIAPVMLLLLLGFFDLAHRYYAAAVLQGAVQKAGRDSTLESGQTASTTIDSTVKSQVARIVGSEAKGTIFVSKRLAYTNFDQVGDAEVFKDKAPFNGTYNAGECFEDLNGNGKWDADLGRTGQGSATDAVLYKMTVTYSRAFPFATLFYGGDTDTVVASTVLRNQPYGDQIIPSVTKCP